MAQAKLNTKTETRTEEKRVVTEVKTEVVDSVTLELTLDEARMLRTITGFACGGGLLQRLNCSVWAALNGTGVGYFADSLVASTSFQEVTTFRVEDENLPEPKETREDVCGTTINEVSEKVPGVFAEGDRVVFNQDYSPAHKGDTGMVIGVSAGYGPGGVLVHVKTASGYHMTSFAHRLDHLKGQPKLRVGARILAKEEGSQFRPGDTGTVLRLEDDQFHKVKWDHYTRPTYAYEERFEVIG